jgi:hypothetical protein
MPVDIDLMASSGPASPARSDPVSPEPGLVALVVTKPEEFTGELG